MTTISFYKTRNNEYQKFVCKGHAGFSVAGEDIVCAAISVLVINTINSLELITKEDIKIETDEKSGYISCEFNGTLKDTSIALMDSLVLGLTEINKQYQKKYIKLKFKEV
ncbi:MAG: ribosomal-processing cysteine protease Prp [Lachnospiraceae bacterium]